VDPKVGLDLVAKRNIPISCQKSNPGRLDRSPVATLSELSVHKNPTWLLYKKKNCA